MHKGGVLNSISVQDWEQVVQDFRTSFDLRQKWLTIWPGLSLLEQALIIILKKEFPRKAQLLVFIEENADTLIGSEVHVGLGMILESLRDVLQSAADGSVVTSAIRESMMVTTTTVAIVSDALHNARGKLEELVELFLVFINRPNYPLDRHLRSLACDSLRELEMAYPCLLYGCVGRIHFLCRLEKTHANQSYTLLLTTVMENFSTCMHTIKSKAASYGPILQNTAPLVPYSVPFPLITSDHGKEIESLPKRDLSAGNLREFRTVVAFLLERPHLLTTVGMLELVSSVIKISKAIDLSGPTLKTHFSSILHSYSPVLCHIVLRIYTQFADSLDGGGEAILRRLIALASDDSQSLHFRVLGVHWLLGVERLHLYEQNMSVIARRASELYASVFDPLSVKATKLGALARCAVALDQQGKEAQGDLVNTSGNGASVLLNQGLLSVSSYQWLPHWSNETQLAFHIFRKFSAMAIPRPPTSTSHVSNPVFSDSLLLKRLQNILVSISATMWKLVPNIVALLDRIMGCACHRPLAEGLLRTFNEELLPQLQPNRQLFLYFPLLERIAENGEIPPVALIDKLTFYIRQSVEDDDDDGDGDEEGESWSRSTQVLGICRAIVVNYQGSRVFLTLVPLLRFLCRSFPDTEVRDTARLYLRMIISIPGNKLRAILKYGDEWVDDANAPQVSSLLRSPSPYKDSRNHVPGASYVQLTRITPLLIRHSWSMVLFDSFQASGGSRAVPIDKLQRNEKTTKIKAQKYGEVKPGRIENAEHDQRELSNLQARSSLRVMDTRILEVIGLLRRHFAEIPDFINGAGLKIRVPCTLKYSADHWKILPPEAESGNGPTLSSCFSSSLDYWPAISGCVVTLKTSGFYGPIPKVRVPLLLSGPPQKSWRRLVDSSSASKNEEQDPHDTDQKENHCLKDISERAGHIPSETSECAGLVQTDCAGSEQPLFSQLVIIELEPKQPVPTLVDAQIEFSDEQGHGVRSQLDSIPISIEDLFTKPPVPSDLSVVDRKEYLLSVFDALWEACSSQGILGSESFSLKGALEGLTILGAESVKLLEAQADRVIAAVEQYLTQFVVAVDGSALTTMAKDGGMFTDVKWLDEESTSIGSDGLSGPHLGSPLMKNMNDESSLQIQVRDPAFSSVDEVSRHGLGSFLLLVFLPPRYHLLLRMEVADESTLVRIRTDHWPCLAHVDEYLEALIFSG